MHKLALAGKKCQSHHKGSNTRFEAREIQRPNFSAGGLRMKLVPLEDRVVLKLMEQEEKTQSGIVLPDTAKEKPSKATVVAAGPGKYDDNGNLVPMPVKVGDIVVFARYAGTEVKVEGEDYLVMRASDLLAILDEKKKSKK